ncbi:MAG TPA: hypothetical protein VLW85_02480 [Myxococcales bacterium]|nr:hypothetical protein [Myxococcales bacterium]
MQRHVLLLLPLLVASAPARVARAQEKAGRYPTMAPAEQYLESSRDGEIALARSAAPPSVSDGAEVLVLGRHGYETAVKGKNGFVCFVERSWTAGFQDPEFWNARERAPNCFNPPAVRTVLPQYLRRAEWVMAGASLPQVIEKTRAEFEAGRFVVPEAGSFSFMLSRQGYLSDEAGGPWLPHVMFFVPHGQAAAWAAGLEGSPVLGAEAGPYEPSVLFIPVRRWSDGSPGPAPVAHTH